MHNLKSYGYDYDWRILNAANYGAFTSRKRFFGQFARHGLPIAFPVPTYAKHGDEGELFHHYKPWKAVREVLDLSDEGTSIFTKKKPLCEKTLERIYAGLVKFVAGGKRQHEAWILKYNSMKDSRHSAPSIDQPCPTVTCQNRLGLVKCQFLSKTFSGDPFSKNISIDAPAGAVTTVDHHALISTQFLSEYYGGADHNHGIDEPCSTLTTRARHAFVTAYYGKGNVSSIEEPSPTATTNPKYQLVTAEQATQKWHYLMNPQFTSKGGSIEDPCFTLIARMDKMPPYLVTTKSGEVGIAIYDTDSPCMRKVKEFMAMYGIVDICMRMLNINELKRIMGFPKNYILIGTQAEQKKFIGNAVEVNMSKVLCEALCLKLERHQERMAI